MSIDDYVPNMGSDPSSKEKIADSNLVRDYFLEQIEDHYDRRDLRERRRDLRRKSAVTRDYRK